VYLSIRIGGISTSFHDEICMSFTAWFNGEFERRFVRLQNRDLFDVDGIILFVSLDCCWGERTGFSMKSKQ